MLKTFLGKSFAGEPERAAQGSGVDNGRLRQLLEFFPIGRRLRYCPEFKKEIVFDSLLIGYCINGRFVYSIDSIRYDADGNPEAFRGHDSESWMSFDTLKLFHILVPDTSELEMTLDYYRRSLIGRGGQFAKGNVISLSANAGAKGVAMLDTEVAKQVVLPDGPYAHTKLIQLEPEWPTLTVTDQRRKARARTCAPVMLAVAGSRLSGPCTIVDMSEEAMRIRVRDRETRMPAMNPGDKVMLDVDLGDGEHCYRIQGSVFRRSAETCVIRLDGQVRDGHFTRFDPLTLIELKAALLNYSK